MKRGLARLVALCCLVLTTLACTPALAGKRVALVIGNADYTGVPSLLNPKNDAEDVSKALEGSGFDVTRKMDIDLGGFIKSLLAFKGVAQDAELAVVYYAGHGVQQDGMNYFLPVDYVDDSPEFLNKKSVSQDDIARYLKGIGAAQLLVFDSCRNNPFKTLNVASRDLDANRGLEPIPAKRGEVAILYSTSQDEKALDGENDRNSPFSKAFVEQLKRPGRQELTNLIHDVIRTVKERTNGKQIPNLQTSITGDYYFGIENDRLEWDAVKDTHDPKVLRDFASRFPTSPFRLQAERLADQFDRAESQRREEEQSVCALSRRLLDMSVAMRDREGLERLAGENACPGLKPEIDAAIRGVAALNQQSRCERLDEDLRRASAARDDVALDALRPDAAACPGLADRINRNLDGLRADRARRQQETARLKTCDDEAGRLDVLRASRGPNRLADIQRLGLTASCDRVRDAANGLVASLRDEDAKTAREAAQAKVCAAETRTLDGLVAQGSRTAVEALGQARRCETLEIAGALARLDDLARQREAQALAACTAVDATRFRDSGDEKGLNDLAARCPSRRDDVAAALDSIKARQRVADACRSERLELRGYVKAGQADAVAALRGRAACADLDITGAEHEIATAACDAASAVVTRADGRDEAALGRLSADPSFCPAARDLASRRLGSLLEARRSDDAACDTAMADAVGRRDASRLRRLSTEARCARRQEAIRAQTEVLRRADQEAAAATRCTADAADLARTASDEGALQAFAKRPQLCDSVRVATGQRLQEVAAAHERDDRACEAALTDAVTRQDVDALQRIAATPLCLRRRGAAAEALAALRGAEKLRIAGAQRKLIRFGCYTGAETGILDAGTRRALASYWAAKHGEGPAPTTVGLDLSSELDALTDPVCPLALPAPLPAAPAPSAVAPAAPGPQAKAEPEAGETSGERQHAILGRPAAAVQHPAPPARKGRAVGAEPPHPPVAAEGPSRKPHRAPVERTEPAAPPPRHRPPTFYAEPAVPRTLRPRREFATQPRVAPEPASAPAETAGPKPHIFY